MKEQMKALLFPKPWVIKLIEVVFLVIIVKIYRLSLI